MKTFYLYTLLLLSLGCKAQEFDLRSMKRFDEKVFKDWEKTIYIFKCIIGIDS